MIKIFLLFTVILALFLGMLQQFRLSQQLAFDPISCGGDWNYNQPCPLGASCEVDEQDPLKGGFCAPIMPGF